MTTFADLPGALSNCSDDYLVRVKAQVMTRDDSSGGWVPMGGGGMSIVGLRKLVISTADDLRYEYLIHGQRIADQSVSTLNSSSVPLVLLHCKEFCSTLYRVYIMDASVNQVCTDT